MPVPEYDELKQQEQQLQLPQSSNFSGAIPIKKRRFPVIRSPSPSPEEKCFSSEDIDSKEKKDSNSPDQGSSISPAKDMDYPGKVDMSKTFDLIVKKEQVTDTHTELGQDDVNISASKPQEANPDDLSNKQNNSLNDLSNNQGQRLSDTLKHALSKTSYTPPEATGNVSIKSELQSLLPNSDILYPQRLNPEIRDLTLCCAALASALNSTTHHLSWIPDTLSILAISTLKDFADARYDDISVEAESLIKFGELELDLRGLESEKKLLIELMPEVLPFLKGKIKESAIDASDESDGISAASARVPVAYAVLAAYQFRWLVTQVDSPYLGKLCPLVIPCALTALDHWSLEVKGQGMISFIHLAKNVNATEIGGYTDVVLDACCQNVASDDEIWHYVVEMSVLLVTLTQQSNPRSSWLEKLFNEMLNHLERQPRNKQRRTAWLTHIEPMFNALGLILVAHFRRLFPLFFKWMHAADDDTVFLVLERIITTLRLTWMRSSSYIERLVDELVTLYKEAALKIAREDIRSCVLQILTLIQLSKSSQFNATWVKYKDDPNLTGLRSFLSERDARMGPY